MTVRLIGEALVVGRGAGVSGPLEVHVTVVVGALKAHVQLVPDADTKLSPTGRVSLITGLLADEGPVLNTCSE